MRKNGPKRAPPPVRGRTSYAPRDNPTTYAARHDRPARANSRQSAPNHAITQNAQNDPTNVTPHTPRHKNPRRATIPRAGAERSHFPIHERKFSPAHLNTRSILQYFPSPKSQALI